MPIIVFVFLLSYFCAHRPEENSKKARLDKISTESENTCANINPDITEQREGVASAAINQPLLSGLRTAVVDGEHMIVGYSLVEPMDIMSEHTEADEKRSTTESRNSVIVCSKSNCKCNNVKHRQSISKKASINSNVHKADRAFLYNIGLSASVGHQPSTLSNSDTTTIRSSNDDNKPLSNINSNKGDSVVQKKNEDCEALQEMINGAGGIAQLPLMNFEYLIEKKFSISHNKKIRNRLQLMCSDLESQYKIKSERRFLLFDKQFQRILEHSKIIKTTKEAECLRIKLFTSCIRIIFEISHQCTRDIAYELKTIYLLLVSVKLEIKHASVSQHVDHLYIDHQVRQYINDLSRVLREDIRQLNDLFNKVATKLIRTVILLNERLQPKHQKTVDQLLRKYNELTHEKQEKLACLLEEYVLTTIDGIIKSPNCSSGMTAQALKVIDNQSNTIQVGTNPLKNAIEEGDHLYVLQHGTTQKQVDLIFGMNGEHPLLPFDQRLRCLTALLEDMNRMHRKIIIKLSSSHDLLDPIINELRKASVINKPEKLIGNRSSKRTNSRRKDPFLTKESQKPNLK